MAELLWRVRDKTSPDIYKNCRLTKRGDVIVVKPDGAVWGSGELTNPDWRIIRLPNVPFDDAVALTAEEQPVDPLNPSRTLLRRAFKFDLDARTPSIQSFLADDTRAQPSLTVNMTLAQFNSLKLRKPSVQDPAVIGDTNTVVG